MSDLMFYLCPHDLDKRRERCLMCEDAKGTWVTVDSLAAALLKPADVGAEEQHARFASPGYQARIRATAIIKAAKEASE